jgi:hypothetical protein
MVIFVDNGEHVFLAWARFWVGKWTMDYVFSTFLYIMKQYNI